MKSPGTKIILALFFILLWMVSGCLVPVHVSNETTYINPSWAPPYDRGVRYYYFPDIEVYYDLSQQEFVYQNNDLWIFSAILPSAYNYYDLNTGFIIVLNWNVYQPWLYHKHYLSHYPRFYYRQYYQRSKTPIRGFNENDRRPIRIIDGDKRITNPSHEGKSKIRAPRKENVLPQTPVIKRSQHSNYRGRTIGQPVRVSRDMREKNLDNRK